MIIEPKVMAEKLLAFMIKDLPESTPNEVILELARSFYLTTILALIGEKPRDMQGAVIAGEYAHMRRRILRLATTLDVQDETTRFLPDAEREAKKENHDNQIPAL